MRIVSKDGGLVYADASGGHSGVRLLQAGCAAVGREDDLVVFPLGSSKGNLTINPFEFIEPAAQSRLITNVLVREGHYHTDDNLGEFLEPFFEVMRFLWNERFVEKTVTEILSHFAPYPIICLTDEEKFPDIPAPTRVRIRRFLAHFVPGFCADRGTAQSPATYAAFQELLAPARGVLLRIQNLFGGGISQINPIEIVENRRILCMPLSHDLATRDLALVATVLQAMFGAVMRSNAPHLMGFVLSEADRLNVDGLGAFIRFFAENNVSFVLTTPSVAVLECRNREEALLMQAAAHLRVFLRCDDGSTRLAYEAATAGSEAGQHPLQGLGEDEMIVVERGRMVREPLPAPPRSAYELPVVGSMLLPVILPCRDDLEQGDLS
jgi:hypothetical protein